MAIMKELLLCKTEKNLVRVMFAKSNKNIYCVTSFIHNSKAEKPLYGLKSCKVFFFFLQR